MKIFKVTVDNNPGSWKAGEDPSTLVLAKDKEDAIEKVKNGWWGDYTSGEGNKYGDLKYEHYMLYSHKKPNFWITFNPRTEFRAIEIRFEMDGYEIEIYNIRKKKLEKLKNLENGVL